MVLFGGQSAEHDVSRVSAHHVLAALNPDRYDVVAVGIGRDGTWHLPSAPVAELVAAASSEGLAVEGPSSGPLAVVSPDGAADVPTVVLPVLHGPNGEDGTIAGMMELAGVAYVGSGVLGSSLSMDKAKAKEVLTANGIAQARYRVAHHDEITAGLLGDVAKDLGLPLFVKPSNMGSSVGISRVTDVSQMNDAVESALTHDRFVVFEEAIEGREIEIGVLGNRDLHLSVPGEIVPAGDFYDYDDKYHDGAAKLIIPAPMTDSELHDLREIARRTYRALRAEGLARVDVFLAADGRGFLVNEINTFPGFTPISMFPMMWEATGVPYSQLLDTMVALALERWADSPRRREGRKT